MPSSHESQETVIDLISRLKRKAACKFDIIIFRITCHKHFVFFFAPTSNFVIFVDKLKGMSFFAYDTIKTKTFVTQ